MQIGNSGSDVIICPSCKSPNNPKNYLCYICAKPINGLPVTRVSLPIVTTFTDAWEYHDFVMKFPKNSMYCRIGSGAYTSLGAKFEFWSECQSQVYEQLQLWIDDGWVPVGEVGPAALVCKEYTSAKYNIFGWIVQIIIACMTFGISLLFMFDTYAEPTEVRIKMRRARAR